MALLAAQCQSAVLQIAKLARQVQIAAYRAVGGTRCSCLGRANGGAEFPATDHRAGIFCDGGKQGNRINRFAMAQSCDCGKVCLLYTSPRPRD